MTDHSAVVGGSNCGRVIACPPSRLQAADVTVVETEHMRNGTLLHDAMEQYLTTGELPAVPEKLRWKLDEAVRVWQLIASDQSVKTIHVEQRLHLAPIPGAFGTVDVLIEHYDNTVTVLDWKFGSGVQVSADTPQLKFYAAAAMTDPSTKHLFNDKTQVKLMIVQPADDGRTLRGPEKVTVLELFDFTRKLSWAIANGHRDELLSSGDHCRWCPIKLVCPKLREQANRALEWSDPHSLTPEEAGEALELANQLETWITSVRQYAHERLNGGGEIPGYKLVPKRAIRKWTDESAVYAWAARVGIQADDRKLKSVAAVEKLVKKRKLSLPDGLYSKVSSGTTIAPEDDPRSAVPSEGQLEQAVDKLKALTLLS